jgi:hypothetical protein
LVITGIIGNANLMDETTVDDIHRGYDFFSDLSEASGLPLAFITVSTTLWLQIDTNRFACPVLPIERQLVPPWKKAKSLMITS